MTKSDTNDARGGQSEEDRLLEKAKRYVEKQERGKGRGDRDEKKKRSHREREDDDRRHKKSSGSRDHKSSSRRDRDRDRDGDRHRDDSRRHRKKRDRSRSRSRSRDMSADRKRHDDDDRRRSKKSKKKDDHKKKDRKHSDKKKHSKDRKDDGNRAKPPSPSKLYPLGPMASKPPADPIDAEADYFAYHQHFRLFLYRTKGIHFEDLSSTETHKMFGKFADKFNDGELEEGYYQAKLPEEALDQCKRTQHKWAFKTNATEQQSLEMVRAGVKKQTEWSVPAGGNAKQSGPGPAAAAVPPRSSDDRGGGEHGRRGRKTPEEIQRERTANRRLREHVKTTHEELTGGKADYGRERQMEKRREKADKMHGGHRDREEALGGPDLDDEALYGGGRDASFQQALAREKSRKARREQQRSDRIGELQKKEDDKAKAMLDMLGLSNIKPGQKIQIAPRKD